MFLPLPACFSSWEQNTLCFADMQGAEEEQEGEPPPSTPSVPTQLRVGGLQLLIISVFSSSAWDDSQSPLAWPPQLLGSSFLTQAALSPLEFW